MQPLKPCCDWQGLRLPHYGWTCACCTFLFVEAMARRSGCLANSSCAPRRCILRPVLVSSIQPTYSQLCMTCAHRLCRFVIDSQHPITDFSEPVTGCTTSRHVPHIAGCAGRSPINCTAQCQENESCVLNTVSKLRLGAYTHSWLEKADIARIVARDIIITRTTTSTTHPAAAFARKHVNTFGTDALPCSA